MIRQFKRLFKKEKKAPVTDSIIDPITQAPWDYVRDYPWEHFGMKCPTGCLWHQPHPTPWYSGESVFAEHPLYARSKTFKPREKRFYHVVFHDDQPVLDEGDILEPLAVRKTLGPREEFIADDGCLDYKWFDVHGVYITDRKPPDDCFPYYEVRPIGRMWVDPERGPLAGESPHSPPRDWCVDSAKIIRVVHPE